MVACETERVSKRPRPLVTLEGYSVEGGFDRAYEPQTCFSATIALGRHVGPADAASLWRDYEGVLDTVAELGLCGVRLSLEWARVEPRRGELDEAALSRYGEVIAYALALGLELDVTLVDAAWPSWLGLEAWLLPWVEPHVRAHARRVAQLLGELAGGDAVGIVVFAERRRLVEAGYLEASAPPWRRGAQVDAAFARAQLERIDATLRDDALVGPRLVGRSSTLGLDVSGARVRAWREHAGHARLYARTVLAGYGPSASTHGLIERAPEGWRVVAERELLEALR